MTILFWSPEILRLGPFATLADMEEFVQIKLWAASCWRFYVGSGPTSTVFRPTTS